VPAQVRVRHAAAGRTYTIRLGDYLTKIAQRECLNAADWTGIAAANPQIKDPNLVYPQEVIKLACRQAMLAMVSAVQPAVSARHDQFDGQHGYGCGDGDGDGFDMPCSLLHHRGGAAPHRQSTAVVTSSSGVVGTAGMSAFEQCVIARESGGNSQVMNASGHWGLYQFSAGTWAAYGGNPADFGRGSAAEQRQVFLNAMSHPGGAQNWSPYDGC
jgi:LysM repeat protein